MKKLIVLTVIYVLLTMVSLFMFSQCSSVVQPEDDSLKAITNSSEQKWNGPDQGTRSLTDQEKADLLYMREEEKLARDMYNFLFETWGLSVFNKIAPSEQRHMDALKRMIDKHKMTEIDPVVLVPEPGMFVNEKIQGLYNELAEKGVLTQTDALEVGVLVEEIDIEDLEFFLQRVDNQDIINVYENLVAGSYSHLASFESLLP